MISEYPFYGIGPKTKTQKLRRIFIFGSTNLKQICTCFLIIIVTFWMLNEHKQRVLLNLSNKKPLTSNLYDSTNFVTMLPTHYIFFKLLYGPFRIMGIYYNYSRTRRNKVRIWYTCVKDKKHHILTNVIWRCKNLLAIINKKCSFLNIRSMFSSYIPWKHLFSGGIEREHCPKIG